jgi:glutathione synthase/RimK-type ligase-like ATP-grasp enzyme
MPAHSTCLLVTCSFFPEGEPGHEHLDRALADRGLSARWVPWDDPGVDWGSAGLVAVRSTWDYDTRLPEFLDWAGAVGPRLLNGVEVFAWNTDKTYLVELAAAGLPVVPTRPAGEARPFETTVLKPRVGAGGRGVVVVGPEDPWPAEVDGLIAQPLVESVRTDGETSVFVLGGRAVSQVVKHPALEEIRVHEEYGGSTRTVDLDPEVATLAEQAIAEAERLRGFDLAYGRVDLMRWQDEWVISELELTEPGLYLDELPGNADAFATVVADRLSE